MSGLLDSLRQHLLAMAMACVVPLLWVIMKALPAGAVMLWHRCSWDEAVARVGQWWRTVDEPISVGAWLAFALGLAALLTYIGIKVFSAS